MNLEKEPFYVYVDSKDRISGTNTDFIIDFSRCHQLLNRPCKLMPKSLEFCLNSIYQINDTNSLFAFSVDGASTISFNIPAGSYTVTSLTALLKTQMEALDGNTNTYVFGYNADRNRITFTPTYASGTLELRTVINDDRVNEVLGLDGSVNVTVLSGNTYEFPFQCNFNPSYVWYLCCDQFVNRSVASKPFNLQNSFARMVSLSRFSRFVAFYSDVDSNIVYCSSFKPQMRFYVLDQNGIPVTMDSNLNNSFSLRVFPL